MKKTSSCVYNINYHIVFCPKYRKQIFEGIVKEFLEDQIKTIAKSKEWNIIDLQIMPDHIHLFISTKPYISPTNIVKILKGITALRIFEKYPDLKQKEFWNRGLWSPSYYVGTAGTVTVETIKKYIDGVKNRGRNSSTD